MWIDQMASTQFPAWLQLVQWRAFEVVVAGHLRKSHPMLDSHPHSVSSSIQSSTGVKVPSLQHADFHLGFAATGFSTD